MTEKRYRIAHLADLPGTPCPCGVARRAFADDPDNDVASVHLTDIHSDAETHFHKQMTEIYVILEGEGHMELDGERVPVKPLTTVMIKPGCRHRAVGRMRILNIPVPPFDAADEWVVS
ncbi:MAG: cupin domain-containing protein [Alphaproteobacteria bacterium]|nr:cupin domain-containing protein [Alphaproteobacteria bacterium]